MAKRTIAKIITVLLVVSTILAIALLSVSAAEETAGGWSKTLFGTRYYYTENQYYIEGWYEIDGVDYYFENGVRMDDGLQLVGGKWYAFAEDGTSTADVADGFYTDRNGYAYAKDGAALVGLQEIDGKFYYFNEAGYAQKNGVYGGYFFTEDYEAYTGLYEADGATYYYVSGKADHVIKNENGTLKLYVNGSTSGKGLYKFGDDYYYSDWGGLLITGRTQYVSATYATSEIPTGDYEFGFDGKMLDGVVNKNGKLYLYVKGNTVNKGVYELDGDYYYADWGGALITDRRYYVSNTYATDEIPAGEYSFGADGKMLNGIADVDGTLKLYELGNTVTKGLYAIDGDYYYADWGGLLITDKSYYVSNLYATSEIPSGDYEFGADGKMLNGAIDVDGTLKLYIKGATVSKGIYNVYGDIYYADWGGVLNVNGRYFVSMTIGTDEVPSGNYEFGADGKMLEGVVEKDGELYCYTKGNLSPEGIIKLGEDFYYVKNDGKLVVDTTFKVEKGNGYTVELEYIFDKSGKIVDIVRGRPSSEGLEFELNADGKSYTVVEVGSCTDTDIVIGYYNNLPVTAIGERAFYYCRGLTRVTIPDSVTSIGDYAFSGCSNLDNIQILSGVIEIGEGAFNSCPVRKLTIPFVSAYNFNVIPGQYQNSYYLPTTLRTVIIPEGTTSIRYRAFYDCSGLTSITIPDSVTSIGEGAFSGCSGLTSITIPDSVTSIGDNAFSWCSSFTSITIPDSVTSIGYSAFYGCSNLTSVTIGNGVKNIDDYAFRFCRRLKSVTIGNGVETIGTGVFCDSIITSITVPDSVTSIALGAFSYCDSLKSITIPFVGATKDGTDNTNFGYIFGASSYSSNYNKVPDSLKRVVITGGTSIGVRAFYDCGGLTSVTIPDTVTSIGDYAFYSCSGLTSITFENTEGWSAGDTTLSSADLANSSTAATYLRSTHSNKTWTRK